MHKNDTEYHNRRKSDFEKTQKVEKFMDRIYSQLKYDVERITDPHLQKKGVDIIHTLGDGTKLFVDEKFAINYYNRDLYTYSFELASHNNVDNQGWFTSDNSITTHYMLLWFNCDDNFEKFSYFDIAYVPKQKIWNYLYSIGYTDTTLDEFRAYWESDNPKPKFGYYEKNNRRYYNLGNGIKIVQSMQFEKECPINVVIPKDILIKIAYKHIVQKKKG